MGVYNRTQIPLARLRQTWNFLLLTCTTSVLILTFFLCCFPHKKCMRIDEVHFLRWLLLFLFVTEILILANDVGSVTCPSLKNHVDSHELQTAMAAYRTVRSIGVCIRCHFGDAVLVWRNTVFNQNRYSGLQSLERAEQALRVTVFGKSDIVSCQCLSPDRFPQSHHLQMEISFRQQRLRLKRSAVDLVGKIDVFVENVLTWRDTPSHRVNGSHGCVH